MFKRRKISRLIEREERDTSVNYIEFNRCLILLSVGMLYASGCQNKYIGYDFKPISGGPYNVI